jgi:uncharacterized protein YijF (DUF1287 family)
LSLFLAYLSLQDHAVNIPDTFSQVAKDFVKNARSQIGKVTKYDTSYYSYNEIPEESGTCADVIWRALLPVGYDLREKLEKDIKENPQDYPKNPEMDPNVNFRRVKMLRVYLQKFSQNLTTEIIPKNVENLMNWQAGDIVTFDELETSHLEHIAIISDKRNSEGVPLIIHNFGQGTQENDYLLKWPSKINGHFRLF